LGLVTDLGEGPVALDTSIFIYFIEQHPLYLPALRPVFTAIAEGHLAAVTSSLSLLEVLVGPLRRGQSRLADEYEDILTRSGWLRLVPLDLRLFRVAAHLRAGTRMKTPDAIQLASALVADCTAFLTNDGRIPAIPGIKVLSLDSYVPDR
jgi:predicted nucleic acid-binding protein